MKAKHLRILLLDDDPNLAKSVIDYLEIKGMKCDYCPDGKQGINLLKNHKFDVIICDIVMPNMNGYQFCTWLRNAGYITPVIMLSGLTDLADKLAGFNSGADDYLTKPFAMKELVARLKSLSKQQRIKQSIFKIPDIGLELNLETYQIKRDNIIINLPQSSWTILEKLMRSYPKPASYQDLSITI